MNSPTSPVKSLRECLESLPETGNIGGEVWKQILPRLEDAWSSLGGSLNKSTSADKLYRAENMAWTPPVLTFTLERHGGTVNGSSRAELHHWQVNIETGVAAIVKVRRRQLSPMDSRLDVAALAREARERIVAGEKHESLKWVDDTYVLIVIGNIIPATYAQTASGRRKRFRAALDKEMTQAGWQRADQGSRCGYRRIAAA